MYTKPMIARYESLCTLDHVDTNRQAICRHHVDWKPHSPNKSQHFQGGSNLQRSSLLLTQRVRTVHWVMHGLDPEQKIKWRS